MAPKAAGNRSLKMHSKTNTLINKITLHVQGILRIYRLTRPRTESLPCGGGRTRAAKPGRRTVVPRKLVKSFKRGSLCLTIDNDPVSPGQTERLGEIAEITMISNRDE